VKRDDFRWASGDRNFVADFLAEQGLRQRGYPTDETRGGICFILTDERETALRTVRFAQIDTHAKTDAIWRGVWCHQPRACLALLPVAQIPFDPSELNPVIGSFGGRTLCLDCPELRLNLLETARGHEIGVRAHRAFWKIFRNFAAVVFTNECATHGMKLPT